MRALSVFNPLLNLISWVRKFFYCVFVVPCRTDWSCNKQRNQVLNLWSLMSQLSFSRWTKYCMFDDDEKKKPVCKQYINHNLLSVILLFHFFFHLECSIWINCNVFIWWNFHFSSCCRSSEFCIFALFTMKSRNYDWNVFVFVFVFMIKFSDYDAV